MSDLIKHSKKVLSIALTITTVVWSLGLFAIPLTVEAAAGDLVKQAGQPAVYLVDANGVTIHPFPHANVYTSWGFPVNFSSVITTDISGFTVGNDVEFRDGALVRALETPAVYFKSAGNLRPIVSANVFETLGLNYDNITWLPQSFLDKYTKGDLVSSTTVHPEGSVIKYANSSALYLIQAGTKRQFASTDVLKVNGYANIPVITVPSTETYPDGAKIVVKEASLTVPSGVGAAPATGTIPPVATGSGVTVALASDNPAAATILADSDANTYPQALVPFMKVNFMAGSDGAVQVNTVKFERTGVASDSDIGNLYLYDGNTRLAEYSSFNSKIVTFSNSSGLFTVSAGSTKAITLKADLARGSSSVSSGKTIGFKMVAASSVTTSGATVSGSFPLSGAEMSTAQVSDLGHVYATSYTTYPSTIKADAAAQELWRFTLNSDSQDMEVRSIKLTLVGTVATTDIKDLKLEVGGAQIGSTAQIMTDKTVTFSGLNYKITSGQSKVVVVRGSMNGGSGKTFKFTIQRTSDVEVYDANYGVYNTFNITGATTAFALIEPTTGNGTSVSSGSLTVGLATDSPSGTIADGATGVTVAKFSFTASGEDIKIESLKVQINNSDDDADTEAVNVKTLLDGSQIGTTDASLEDATDSEFTYGNTFRVNAGQTRYVTVVMDTTDAGYAAAETITASLSVGASNAQGLTTLTSISTTAQTARTLTLAAGTITAVKNAALADFSSTNPTGTVNASEVKIASFIITAGSGEAVDVTQIVLKDTGTATQMGDNFQNLKLKNGSTPIGNAIGSLDTSGTAATYTFTPASSIRISAGAQYTVDVYADILSNPADDGGQVINANGGIEIDAISATGVSTSSDAGIATGANTGLQNHYIAAAGNLTITLDGNTPAAQQVIMGATDVEVARFKLAADASEDITISKAYIAAQVNTAAATGTWSNVKLYKDSVSAANMVGSASSFGTTSTTTYAVAPFVGISLTVPRNGNIVLIVTADVGANPNATTNSTTEFALLPDYDGSTTGNQEAFTALGASSGVAITGDTMDFTTADNGIEGNTMTVYATKISVAYASDTPSGASVAVADQTIMKVVVTNTTNVGGYAATIKIMNFGISLGSGVSRQAASAVDINVYKTSINSSNLVGTTRWLAADNVQVGDTNMAGLGTTAATESSSLGFEDTEVASGQSQTFVVTLDTDNLGLAADEKISVNLAASDIAWRDGVISSNITAVNSLPLSVKTLTY